MLWVEAHTPMGASHADVIAYLVEQIPEDFERLYPSIASWGTSKAAQQGLAAAEAAVGGPAAPRSPGRRPASA